MENFTPISALAGGVLIGLSAVMLMFLNGRIAGVSGVFSGVVFAEPGERAWRLLFVLGMVAAPLIYFIASGTKPPFYMTDNWPLIAIAGFMVGFGTRLGSGCTSGHGVCGISRLSPRSMAAVAIFMITGMAVASLGRMVFGG